MDKRTVESLSLEALSHTLDRVIGEREQAKADLRTAERLLALWLNPLADGSTRFQATRAFLKR